MQVSGQADTYTDTARSPKSAPDGRSQPRTLLVDRTAVHPVRSGIMAAERRTPLPFSSLMITQPRDWRASIIPCSATRSTRATRN